MEQVFNQLKLSLKISIVVFSLKVNYYCLSGFCLVWLNGEHCYAELFLQLKKSLCTVESYSTSVTTPTIEALCKLFRIMMFHLCGCFCWIALCRMYVFVLSKTSLSFCHIPDISELCYCFCCYTTCHIICSFNYLHI